MSEKPAESKHRHSEYRTVFVPDYRAHGLESVEGPLPGILLYDSKLDQDPYEVRASCDRGEGTLKLQLVAADHVAISLPALIFALRDLFGYEELLGLLQSEQLRRLLDSSKEEWEASLPDG